METERLTPAARSDLDRSRRLTSRLLSASDEPRAEMRSALLDSPLGDLAGSPPTWNPVCRWSMSARG